MKDKLINNVTKILFEQDPVGISKIVYEDTGRMDEYAIEAKAITNYIIKYKPRTIEKILDIVYRVFIYYFEVDYGTTTLYKVIENQESEKIKTNVIGPKSKYEEAAKLIWEEWKTHN